MYPSFLYGQKGRASARPERPLSGHQGCHQTVGDKPAQGYRVRSGTGRRTSQRRVIRNYLILLKLYARRVDRIR